MLDQRGVARPQGPAADIGSVEVELSGEDVTVVVTPPANQTITFGQSPSLTPTWTGFTGNDDWTTDPTCAVYDAQDVLVTTSPLPAGSYKVKCSGGVLPSGYTADYTATRTLTVNKATPTVTYTGGSVVVSGAPLNPSAVLSPSGCTGAITYKIDGAVVTPSTVYPDGTYEVEIIYAGDSNCNDVTAYSVVSVGGTASASNGGGWYNVQGVGRVNFGYTVQVNKSKNGSTQVRCCGTARTVRSGSRATSPVS